MTNEKSEKQLEAKRLISQIVRLSMTPVSVNCRRKIYDGTWIDNESIYYLCLVNGVKYIRKTDIGWKIGNFIKIMERNGTITSNDFLHFCNQSKDRYQGGKINVLIKTDVLLELKNEMVEYLKHGDWAESSIEEAKSVFEAINNTSVAIGENIIDEEKLIESEAAYARRNELIRENNIEKRKKEWLAENEERELEKLRLQKSLHPESETLKDLVSKIESMGWEVSLRIKSQVDPQTPRK